MLAEKGKKYANRNHNRLELINRQKGANASVFTRLEKNGYSRIVILFSNGVEPQWRIHDSWAHGLHVLIL
jgi:hypothetical protein